LYIRNVLHVKLVKITVNLEIRLRPDLSFHIRQNPAPAGSEENKSGTALISIVAFRANDPLSQSTVQQN